MNNSRRHPSKFKLVDSTNHISLDKSDSESPTSKKSKHLAAIIHKGSFDLKNAKITINIYTPETLKRREEVGNHVVISETMRGRFHIVEKAIPVLDVAPAN